MSFTAVPDVIRYSELIQAIRATDKAAQYASFKFIGGMVDRYQQQQVEWVVDRASSGGGALLNLGVHFMDLCRVLLPDAELTVTGSIMSNRNAHILRIMPSSSCREAAPVAWSKPDMYTARRIQWWPALFNTYSKTLLNARDDSTLEIVSDDRRRSIKAMKLTNMHFYPTFVQDTLQRLKAGHKPIADLSDNAAAVRLVEAAYMMSPLT